MLREVSMHSFFRFGKDSRETIIGQVTITIIALLFLLISIIRSLPDADTVKKQLNQNAVAGFEQVSITTPHRKPILEEYYDNLPIDPPSDSNSSTPDKTVKSIQWSKCKNHTGFTIGL